MPLQTFAPWLLPSFTFNYTFPSEGIMKFSALATISFAALGVAAPAEDVYHLAARSNNKRQACQYGFVFARGSAELPPIVCFP
jgi:hypothetical protein